VKPCHSSKKTGGRDDWRTLEKILAPLRAGWLIGLDPCASRYPEHHVAAVNLDAARDGLSMPWATIVRGTGGVVFTNWPYSSSPLWAEKVRQETEEGAPIIALCAARPGAAWYRELKQVADVVGEVRGRLTFLSGDAPDAPANKTSPKRTDSAPFPSALIGLNVSWRRFAHVFAEVADCEVPR
jgi:hypothetical protein